jgi:hypothetical protein
MILSSVQVKMDQEEALRLPGLPATRCLTGVKIDPEIGKDVTVLTWF